MCLLLTSILRVTFFTLSFKIFPKFLFWKKSQAYRKDERMVGITWQNPSLPFLDWQRFVNICLISSYCWTAGRHTHHGVSTHAPTDLGLVSPSFPSSAFFMALNSVAGMWDSRPCPPEDTVPVCWETAHVYKPSAHAWLFFLLPGLVMTKLSGGPWKLLWAWWSRRHFLALAQPALQRGLFWGIRHSPH